MAHRKANCQKSDFATKLLRIGFIQIGDCTFSRDRIKIFRTNKTNSDQVRYWEVQEISTGKIFFKSNHASEVINFLSHTQFLAVGASLQMVVAE